MNVKNNSFIIIIRYIVFFSNALKFRSKYLSFEMIAAMNVNSLISVEKHSNGVHFDDNEHARHLTEGNSILGEGKSAKIILKIK